MVIFYAEIFSIIAFCINFLKDSRNEKEFERAYIIIFWFFYEMKSIDTVAAEESQHLSRICSKSITWLYVSTWKKLRGTYKRNRLRELRYSFRILQ